jgi:hypothetical protein
MEIIRRMNERLAVFLVIADSHSTNLERRSSHQREYNFQIASNYCAIPITLPLVVIE